MFNAASGYRAGIALEKYGARHIHIRNMDTLGSLASRFLPSSGARIYTEISAHADQHVAKDHFQYNSNSN